MPTGSTIFVHSGDDLQAIYNAASCGQDLVLDAGAVFTGNYVFNKQCTTPDWILVEGAGCADGSAAIPTYVTQASANYAGVPPWPPPSLTHYATLSTGISVPPLTTTDSSFVPGRYNYFGCLEVTSSVLQYALIGTSNSLLETVASQLGDHFIFDRIYAHGHHSEATAQMVRAFMLAGSNISVVNSYVSEIYAWGDSQAIGIAHGPGPIFIHNNFLSSDTEIIMAGGTGPTPGYSCTIAASPAPTSMSATVNNCVDAAGGSVAAPAVGTEVMFYTSASPPYYVPGDATTITSSTGGALTFTPILTAPLTGAGMVAWGLRPNDITITKNYFWKDPCWNAANPCYDGIARSSKDFVEAKYGQRWNIDGNIFVNTWNAGQADAFNFNSADQYGDCPWCFSSDISLTNNIVKNISGDLTIIGTQTGGAAGSSNQSCPPILNRVLVQNNLFFTKGAAPYIAPAGSNIALARDNGGCTYPQQQAVDSLQIIHNTFLGAYSNMQLSDDSPFNYSNLVIRDNLTEFDQIRWFVVSGGCTEPCFASNASTGGSWTATHNAIVNSGAINGGAGISDATIISRYGSMVLPTLYDTNLANNYSAAPFVNYAAVDTDYHNFALTGTGPWRNAASDGTDPGVNLANLDAAIPVSTTPLLPPIDLSGINGKTFNVSDDLSFPYSATGVNFTWSFQGTGASASSTQGTPASGNAAFATTQAPKLSLSQFSLSPGKYVLTVTVTQGGQFQTASATITLVTADLSNINVAPNPWRSDKHTGKPITFSQLSANTTIKIFTTSGHEVKRLTGGPSVTWDLTNDSGDKVGSGIYIYLLTDPQGNKVKGKLAVIK